MHHTINRNSISITLGNGRRRELSLPPLPATISYNTDLTCPVSDAYHFVCTRWDGTTKAQDVGSKTMVFPMAGHNRLPGGKIHHSDLLFMSMAHNSSSVPVQVDFQKSQCIPPILITTLPSISISCNKSFCDEKATMSGSAQGL
jgi:hypothetical protein